MEAKALMNKSSVEIVGGIVYRGTHNDGTDYTITINSAKRETKFQQNYGYNYIFTFDVTINNPVNDNLTITYTIKRVDANKLANNSNSWSIKSITNALSSSWVKRISPRCKILS